MKEKGKKVKLYSYLKVWKVEKKIYAISNMALPVPVNPYDLLYFLGVLFLIYILGRIIPVIASIPGIIRLVLLPYGITKYMVKVKLDGKNPIKYFTGYISYAATEKGRVIEKYQIRSLKSKSVKLKWNCSEGWQ